MRSGNNYSPENTQESDQVDDTLALLDVDETLLIKGKDEKYILNMHLIDALLAKGIKQAYLFTVMELSSDISCKLKDPNYLSREDVIGLLKEKGMQVLGVITSADIGYENQHPDCQNFLGAAYREMYVPLYEKWVGGNTKKTSSEFEGDQEVQAKREKFNMLRISCLKEVIDNDNKKKPMFELFLKHKPLHIHSIVFCDDQKKILEDTARYNQAKPGSEPIHLTTVLVTSKDERWHYDLALEEHLNSKRVEQEKGKEKEKEEQKEVAIDEGRRVYVFNYSAIFRGQQLIHPALACFHKKKENEEKIENREEKKEKEKEKEERKEKEAAENKEGNVDLPVVIIPLNEQSLPESDISSYQDEEFFTLKLGDTTIKISVTDYRNMRESNPQALTQLIAIFRELDKAKLAIILPRYVAERFFVYSIETPSHYSRVYPHQIVLTDERPEVCEALRDMRFTVIDADTAVTKESHEDSVNSYLTHLWQTLPVDERPKMGEVTKFQDDSSQEKRPVAILDLNLLIHSAWDANRIIQMLKRDNIKDLYVLQDFNLRGEGANQINQIKKNLGLLKEKGFTCHAILSRHDLKRSGTYNRLGYVYREFVQLLWDETDSQPFSIASIKLNNYKQTYHHRGGPVDPGRDLEQELLAYFTQHQPQWVESCVLYTQSRSNDEKSIELEAKTVRISSLEALEQYEGLQNNKCKEALQNAVALFQEQAKQDQEEDQNKSSSLHAVLKQLEEKLTSNFELEAGQDLASALTSPTMDIIIKTTDMLTTLHDLQTKAKQENPEQTQAAILELMKNYERDCRQSPAWTYYMPEIVAVISAIILFTMGLVVFSPAAPLLGASGFFAGKKIGKEIEKQCFTRSDSEKQVIETVKAIKSSPLGPQKKN